MKKILIEGINGSLELNKKYIYLIINTLDNTPNEEFIIWFDEIENVVYKKPTKFKYGYISLVLSIKGLFTSRKKEYKIILNRIDEKSIESNKTIYLFIRGIIDNKEVKVLEEVETEEQKEEPVKEIGVSPVPKKDAIEEIRKIIKENNQQINKIIKQEEKKEEKQEKVIVEKKAEVSLKPVQEEKEKIVDKEPIKQDIEKPIDKEEKKQEEQYVLVDYNSIEEEINDEFDEIEEQEEKEERVIKSVSKLENKMYELEKDLQTITYKEMILSDYIDDTLDRKKIDKLIIELKKLIEKIEKIKKEILKHEKAINEDEFVKLDSGNVTILSMSRSLIDETELDSYISEYKDVVKKLDRVQKDTEELKEKSEQKKNDIGLSNEEYERMINQFKGAKTNKEYISKLIKETKESLSKVKWKIETTIETKTKYKYVKRSISQQTKRLAAIAALNRLRPNPSRFSVAALSFFAGVSSIHDLLGYDLKQVQYNEIVQKEYLEGLDYLDTSKARALINNSKYEIEGILEDCERKYGNYPGFNSLKKNLESLKNEIESQDRELSMLEEKIYDYNSGPKTKVLRHAA